MNQAQKIPYVIEGTIPDRYPRGWFCIGAGYEFTNEPRMMNYFGTSLVGYRGEDSQVHILDAYCPHMGANLADGQVNGNSVVCPFHAWSWGADGVCNNIPYAKKIPPKAVIKTWPTMEENNLVYVWCDLEEGSEPPEDQIIPRHEWLDSDDNWSPWIIDRAEVPSNARELIDNMADVAHFAVVHKMDEAGMNVVEFKNIAEKHTYRQIMNAEMADGSIHYNSVATYYGPGYMVHTMDFFDKDDNRVDRMMSLVINVPTGLDSFQFIAGFKHIMPADIQGDETNPAVKAFMDQTLADHQASSGVYADLAIWQSKTTIDNPILCDGDGPVNRLRQWYNQFLVPVDQIPAVLNERKVYEKALE